MLLTNWQGLVSQAGHWIQHSIDFVERALVDSAAIIDKLVPIR